jgi:H/ACA ribonucleoprotein complex subunit 4
MTSPLLRRVRTTTDSRFGKKPEDRTIEELLKNSIVVIDKPMGPTSHQLAAWVRDMLGVEKTGHGGTLDPRATGVLPVGIGNSVRAMDFIHEAGKRYVGVMRLHGEVDDASLQRTAQEFTGELFQTPPVRSAVKRVLRIRNVYVLNILERSDRDVLIDVTCEGGTYIRSLCVDIGDALGIGAHLQDLRRIEAGPFKESEAIGLHTLKDAIEFHRSGDPKELRRILSPIERVFDDWKRIIAKDSAVDALCHGAPLAVPGVVELTKDIALNDRIAIYTSKGEVVAVGRSSMTADEMVASKDGVAAKLERVFMEPGTYPRSWLSKSTK